MTNHNYYGFCLRCEAGAQASAQPLIYLASPYTPISSEVFQAQARLASAVAALIREHGYEVFCPAAHDFMLAEHASAPWRTVRTAQQSVLRHADALVVLNTEGTFENLEVLRAVNIAAVLGIPVNLVTPGAAFGAYLDGELAVEPDISPAAWRTPRPEEPGMPYLQVLPKAGA